MLSQSDQSGSKSGQDPTAERRNESSARRESATTDQNTRPGKRYVKKKIDCFDAKMVSENPPTQANSSSFLGR